MARVDLHTPAGASLEVRALTTAERIELLGDEEQLQAFILNQDGTDAYRPAIARMTEKATATEDKNLPGVAPKKNRAYDWLYATADFFLACSDPQGFPWGETLAEVWFQAPEGRFDGLPNFWSFGVMQERNRRQLEEAEVKN